MIIHNPFAGASLRQPISVDRTALYTGATIGLGPVVLKKKRGRPKKYTTEAERKVAEATAKRKKRAKQEAQRERMRRRRIIEQSTPLDDPVLVARLKLYRAIENKEPQEVLIELYEEVSRAEEMKEYDEQIARQEARDAPVTLDDLLHGADLADGKYLADAPEGAGLIISGGYGANQVTEILDARQARQSGRRVGPTGFGPQDEDGNAPRETDEQWAKKRCRWKALVNCYRPECKFPVVGVLQEDKDKPAREARYHCWLHTPLDGVSPEEAEKPVLTAPECWLRVFKK